MSRPGAAPAYWPYRDHRTIAEVIEQEARADALKALGRSAGRSVNYRKTENATGRHRRPMPDDFREVAPGKSVNALMAIYRCGPGPVARWRKEAGIPTNALATVARHIPEKLKTEKPVAAPRAKPVARIIYRQVQPRPLPDRRDNSRAGLAAQFLQRFGPVFRCDENGRANPDGKHWNRGGRTVLTDDEIIARAERNGWVQDAWKAIAA